MRMPLIVLVADRKSATAGPWVDVPTDGIPHSYVRAIEQAGGAPLLIPSLEVHRANPQRLLDHVDGLFLPGGRDLDAQLFGEDAHPANDAPIRVRDELEIALVREALKRRLPVFGACRGAQVINVALGGTLEQHLGDRVDLTPHRATVGEFTVHEIAVAPGTLLSTIVPQRNFSIASHHHQAVGNLGDGLVASAFAPDGVVEAIEAQDGSFCLGVQWHPEEQLELEGISLMRAFIRAAEAHGTKRAR